MWYRAGTVTLTNGSKSVVGVGTSWNTSVKPGDVFFATANRTDLYEVQTVTDGGHIALSEPYRGDTAVGASYAIIINFTNTPNAQLAADYANLMDKVRVREAQFQAWLTGSATGGPNGNGYYPITNLMGEDVLVPCPALIVVPTDPGTPGSPVAQPVFGSYTHKTYDNPGWWQELALDKACNHTLLLNQPSCEIVLAGWDTQPNRALHHRLILKQTQGSHKVDWASIPNLRWVQGREPILSVQKDRIDVVDLFSNNGGATWMGFFSGSRIPA